MENSNGMPQYFVSGLQPLLFITAMCSVAFYLLTKPRFAASFICSKAVDGNALNLYFPFCEILEVLLKFA